MIRNEKVDRSDVRHQEREFEALKVFVRIPFSEDLPGLKESLALSSKDSGLKLVDFKASSKRPKPGARRAGPPPSMYSDENPSFKLTDDQLAERIPFEAVVEGDKRSVEAWIRSWATEQMRLAVAESRQPEPLGQRRWRVRAHAFRFRDVRYPELEPREPLEVLPGWAGEIPSALRGSSPCCGATSPGLTQSPRRPARSTGFGSRCCSTARGCRFSWPWRPLERRISSCSVKR